MEGGPRIAIDAMGGDNGPATMIAGAVRALRKDSSLHFTFYGDEAQVEAEIAKHAVVNLADVLNEVLADAGLTAADVDWVVPHQANARILDATAKKLGLSPEKVVVTVDQHAVIRRRLQITDQAWTRARSRWLAGTRPYRSTGT